MMKAYAIIPYDSGDGALLVFAPNRNRARFMALTHGTWEYDGYATINARRAPVYDGAFDVETIVDMNEDLPPGYPPFYSDEDWA
jgi:hypothetical protein